MGVNWGFQPLGAPAELIGDSPATVAARALIDQVAGSAASVLITGPSGSGKEVVAQLLHQRSGRAARPFVAVNCAAIPRELIESEIFGHDAGAFTGAMRARRGRFEAADTGTLFLDEIGDMPADMQVKLLRILETRVVERVGSSGGIRVDVRVVAATNANLHAAIDSGRFREDLYYRLNVVEIALPPLCQRRADIAPLLAHFAAGPVAGVFPARIRFTADATAWLTVQAWRGNVRELRNFVDRAAALHPHATIDRDMAEQLLRGNPRPLDAWLAAPPLAEHRLPRVRPAATGDTPVDLKALLEEVEQAYIEQALGRSAGGVAESARMLGLRRTTLVEKMRRLNIQRPVIN